MIEEMLHVITDPGHLLAEVILEVVSYATVGRLAIWWHDRTKHPSGHPAEQEQGGDRYKLGPSVLVTSELLEGNGRAIVCNEEHPCDRCVSEGFVFIPPPR